jgi:hypothetical protein
MSAPMARLPSHPPSCSARQPRHRSHHHIGISVSVGRIAVLMRTNLPALAWALATSHSE